LEHIEGIHRVPGVKGGNVYLLANRPLTLVDTGLPRSDRAILDFMAALGHRPEALERILLTHRHTDHAGSAASLRETTGARVCAHEAETEVVSGVRFLRGFPGTLTVPVDHALAGGEELEGGIRVVHCGGHTAGSAAYHMPGRRVLFLGDMAINNIDRLSRPLSMANEDSAAYEAALDGLLALDADAGFFGHGPPVLSGLRQALAELKARKPTPAWQGILKLAWMRLTRPRRRD
jgi:glyoxylase-like metal-dependent hydrolase (beta-lactamase superfamily II)